MEQLKLEILEHASLNCDIRKMRLAAPKRVLSELRPGQFINIKLDNLFLRRPISIHDWDETSFTILYKVVGKGTEKLADLPAGTLLDSLVGLGNGFSDSMLLSLLIGGGIGVAPLYALAKRSNPSAVILGFNTKSEVILEDEFKALGIKTIVTTVDGSYGVPGFVTNALPGLNYEYFYACGPEPMLKAVHKETATSGEMSFEARMGCGFGACMGCSCQTLTGYKRICKDGPVMRKEEILW